MAALLRPFMPKTYAQMDRYALAWAAANAAAERETGPLWVVLGDSAAQGIGTPAHDQGYVGVVLDRLRRSTGEPWRVINLSRSGAKTAELVQKQWPQAQDLPAELLTAIVGGNDAVWTPLDKWIQDIDAVTEVLPAGAVVATVARGVREKKTRVANAHLRARAEEKQLRVADLWRHTGPPYRGLYFDGFHPNEHGYEQWVDALGEALELPPSGGSAS